MILSILITLVTIAAILTIAEITVYGSPYKIRQYSFENLTYSRSGNWILAQPNVSQVDMLGEDTLWITTLPYPYILGKYYIQGIGPQTTRSSIIIPWGSKLHKEISNLNA